MAATVSRDWSGTARTSSRSSTAQVRLTSTISPRRIAPAALRHQHWNGADGSRTWPGRRWRLRGGAGRRQDQPLPPRATPSPAGSSPHPPQPPFGDELRQRQLALAFVLPEHHHVELGVTGEGRDLGLPRGGPRRQLAPGALRDDPRPAALDVVRR